MTPLDVAHSQIMGKTSPMKNYVIVRGKKKNKIVFVRKLCKTCSLNVCQI